MTENLICPLCGKSHYAERGSTRTAAYYAPVWKDGVNINPDKNITTSEYDCMECGSRFIVQTQNGEIVKQVTTDSVTREIKS